MSDDITRMWREFNEQKERVVKLESRTETLERQHQQALTHMSKLETSVQSGIEQIGAKQDEFFEYMRRELESLKQDRDTREGYEKGQQKERERILKVIRTWVAIPGGILALIALLTYLATGTFKQ